MWLLGLVRLRSHCEIGWLALRASIGPARVKRSQARAKGEPTTRLCPAQAREAPMKLTRIAPASL